MKYKIAIIGNKESILGFKALGLETFNANSTQEAVRILFKLKAENVYAIVFITEDLASDMEKDDYKKLSVGALPAIIPVPGSKGLTGYGIKRIGKMVEQAIGSDILG